MLRLVACRCCSTEYARDTCNIRRNSSGQKIIWSKSSSAYNYVVSQRTSHDQVPFHRNTVHGKQQRNRRSPWAAATLPTFTSSHQSTPYRSVATRCCSCCAVRHSPGHQVVSSSGRNYATGYTVVAPCTELYISEILSTASTPAPSPREQVMASCDAGYRLYLYLQSFTPHPVRRRLLRPRLSSVSSHTRAFLALLSNTAPSHTTGNAILSRLRARGLVNTSVCALPMQCCNCLCILEPV